MVQRTGATFQAHGGSGLLQGKHNGSVNQLLKTVYPEYHHLRISMLIQCRINWDIHKFKQVSRGFWDDASNQKKFMDDLAKQLNITDQKVGIR